MVTADEIPDPCALTLVTRLNGEEVQRSGTDMLIYDIPHLISYITEWTELLPGDVVATGTPGGVGQSRVPPRRLMPGARVEVEIDGIGTFRTEVIAEGRATDRRRSGRRNFSGGPPRGGNTEG